MVMLTVAAASASAALAASTASGQVMEATGGSGGAAAAVVAPGHGEATTASDLAAPAAIHDEATTTARGVDQIVPGADEATLAARGIGDVAITTAIAAHDEATTARDLAAPAAIHDETTPAARGVDQTVPGADEAGLTARGVGDVAITTAIAAHDEATTARDLAAPTAIHDETTPAARGVDQIVPGADEATLAARGIETPAVHDEGTLVTRGIETEPVSVDSGTGFEMPSLDSSTAAAVGGLAGAGLLIVGAAFVARRQRTTPV